MVLSYSRIAGAPGNSVIPSPGLGIMPNGWWFGIITFDASYPTGGEAIDLAEIGLESISHAFFTPIGFNAGLRLDPTNTKILAFGTSSVTTPGTITGDTDAATTPATNAASSVAPRWEGIDLEAITKPVVALTYDADPVVNLAASALNFIEATGRSTKNVGRLESITDSSADVLGSVAESTICGVSVTPRFFVKDAAVPAGVPIYINEAASYQLEFVSPTTTDGYIVMPAEAIANCPPGVAFAVKVHHSATAAAGKPLFFDDNGAADAQLAFVATDAASHVIPAADILVLRPTYMLDEAGGLGLAAAQVVTDAGHQHGVTALSIAGTTVAEFDEFAAATDLSTLSVCAMILGPM